MSEVKEPERLSPDGPRSRQAIRQEEETHVKLMLELMVWMLVVGAVVVEALAVWLARRRTLPADRGPTVPDRETSR